jgi:DNA processing protein
LISQGAHPLLAVQDLIDVLNLSHLSGNRQVRKILPADEVEANLLDVIGHEPLHVDEICERTGLPISRVSATLTMMELKGLIRQTGGMSFVAVHDEMAVYKTGSRSQDE